MNLQGEARDSTIIQLAPDANDNVIASGYAHPTYATWCGVRHLTIDGNEAENPYGKHGIWGGFASTTFHDLNVKNANCSGITGSFDDSADAYNAGAQDLATLNHISKVWVGGSGKDGIAWVLQADSEIYDIWVTEPARWCLWLGNSAGCHISHALLEKGTNSVFAAWSGNFRLTNFTAAGSSEHSIYFEAGVAEVTIADGVIGSERIGTNTWDGIHIEHGGVDSRRVFVDGVQFVGNGGLTTYKYDINAVTEVGSHFINCWFDPESYGTAPISTVSANSIVRHNIDYVTEASGSATIPNAGTNITVGHGLYTTPTRVMVTPVGDPQSRFWVSGIGATDFDINVASGASGSLDFDWHAWIGDQN